MDYRIPTFNKRWNLTLPVDIESDRRGYSVKQDWCIKFLFGEDTNGKYLDYYATHRVTNDRHIRIRTDRTEERLPTLDWGRTEPKLGEVWKILEEKGFF
ncbi:MAG: hypothetical protein OXG24_09915 [Gammaproteobacteria bacterium]|nr:hypothetical protein [Gammaproteobacteria bacterium]